MAKPWEKFQKAPDSPQEGPWAKFASEEAPKKEQFSKGETALEHGANAASLGYLPQLQAAASKPIYKGLSLLTGKDVEPDSYVEERDRNIARLEAQAKGNPKTALASQIGGTVASAAATPAVGASKGLLSALKGGAVSGAALGALANPGDRKGEVDALQLGERGENAVTGAKFGALGAGVGSGLQKGLSQGAKSIKDFASANAFKGSGAMLKDFRSAAAKNQVHDIGNFMLDKGLIKAGDTFDDVAEKTSAFNKKAGEKLSKVYADAQDVIQNADPNQKEAIANASFALGKDANTILSAVSDKLKNSEGKRAALNRVSNYLDELTLEHSSGPLSPKVANDIKASMDDVINYSRNPLTKQPDTEKAFQIARKMVSEKIDSSIDEIGKVSGKGLLKDLKDANKDYGYSAQVKGIAKDRLNREGTNRAISLTDYISGAAGLAGGGAVGAALGGKPEDALKGAALGVLAGGANKLGRKYGSGILASGGRALSNVAEPVGRTVGPALSPELLSKISALEAIKQKR